MQHHIIQQASCRNTYSPFYNTGKKGKVNGHRASACGHQAARQNESGCCCSCSYLKIWRVPRRRGPIISRLLRTKNKICADLKVANFFVYVCCTHPKYIDLLKISHHGESFCCQKSQRVILGVRICLRRIISFDLNWKFSPPIPSTQPRYVESGGAFSVTL